MKAFRLTFLVLVISALEFGCAKSSTISLSQNTAKIAISAPRGCGAEGAKRTALKKAAIKTIKAGFDKFAVLETTQQNNVLNKNRLPTQETSNSRPSGGEFYKHQITIRMFSNEDIAGENAISAKNLLGPNWQERVQKDSSSCLG